MLLLINHWRFLLMRVEFNKFPCRHLHSYYAMNLMSILCRIFSFCEFRELKRRALAELICQRAILHELYIINNNIVRASHSSGKCYNDVLVKSLSREYEYRTRPSGGRGIRGEKSPREKSHAKHRDAGLSRFWQAEHFSKYTRSPLTGESIFTY